MCGKISYDFEEGDGNIIIITSIDMVIKFKRECKPFWNALLLKKVDEMKAQQANISFEELERKMQQINEECSGYSYKKYKEEEARREDGVGKQGIFGKIGTVVYNLGVWLGSVIFGAFSS